MDAGAYWAAYLGNGQRAPFVSQRVSPEPPSVVWSTSIGSGVQGMPVVTDEVVITASSDRHIQTTSRQDGSTFWRKRMDGPPVSPLVIGEVIYVATENDGRLRALRLDEGDDLWKRDFPPVAVPIWTAGDTLYAASEQGRLIAVSTDEHEEQPFWSARFPGPPNAGPLIVDDWAVYVSFDSLYLVDRFSGLRRSAAHSPEVFVGEAATDGDRIYLATERGSLLSWKLPDLELVWQTSGLGNFLAGPVISQDDGYAVTRSGNIVRFDRRDGSIRVIADADGTVAAPPIVVENGVLLGTLEGNLLFYSRDGDSIWSIDLEGSIDNPFAVHEGRIIVAMYGRVDGPLGTSPLRGKLVELR